VKWRDVIDDPYPFLCQTLYTNAKRYKNFKKRNDILLAIDGSPKENRTSFGYCIVRKDVKYYLNPTHQL